MQLMRKTFANWALYLLAVGLSAMGWGVQPSRAQEYLPSAYPDRVTLTVTATPATSQAVSWRTDTSTAGAKAQLKKEDGSPFMDAGAKEFAAETLPFICQDGRKDLYHRVVFEGLAPATVYSYRVGDGNCWSEWYQFRTASDRGDTAAFSFIYLGDAQNDLKSRWSRAIRQAFSRQPDARFIIHAGDLINRSNSDTEWGEWHHGAGFVHAMIPAVPTPGNHEHVWDDQAHKPLLDPHWAVQFVLPDNGPDGWRESVYYVDYQNLRVIALNSQAFLKDEASLKAQLHWLKGLLRDNPQLWTVVTMHHPVYSTSKNRGDQELISLLKPLFDRYGVDLVLQGHDHTYARGRGHGATERGPVYIVSVAGPKMYKSDSDRWMDVSLTDTQCYQIIRVADRKLHYKAYDVSGESVDSFTLTK